MFPFRFRLVSIPKALFCPQASGRLPVKLLSATLRPVRPGKDAAQLLGRPPPRELPESQSACTQERGLRGSYGVGFRIEGEI